MSAWVTSDTTRWCLAVTGSVRKSMVVTTDAGQPTPAPRESSLGIRASLLTRAKFFRHEGSCRSPRGDTRLLRLSATLVGTFYPLGHSQADAYADLSMPLQSRRYLPFSGVRCLRAR